MLQSAEFNFHRNQENLAVFLRFQSLVLFAVLVLTGVSAVAAQESADKKEKTENKPVAIDFSKGATNAEQVAESAIVIYGGLAGRQNLNQIRKTSVERGKIITKSADGNTENANYERWILRGDSLDKERIRFDREFPNTKYALVYNNDKIFGIYNDSVFTPREDASKAFENQIWHGLEALLRYKENGSTLELVKRDKIMGVDFYIVDVTDKQNRKTRFYVSAKTFRVMMLEYTEDGTEYRRRFYDYNYAQGTLVPYRTVLWANGKQVEETEVQTITFGQKVEDTLFRES